MVITWRRRRHYSIRPQKRSAIIKKLFGTADMRAVVAGKESIISIRRKLRARSSYPWRGVDLSQFLSGDVPAQCDESFCASTPITACKVQHFIVY